MVIRSLPGSTSSLQRIHIAEAPSTTPSTTRAAGAPDVFGGDGPRPVLRGEPALPAGGGFDYAQLTVEEQQDLALRQRAAQLGIELPATRDTIAAVLSDDDVARIMGRSVITQGDVTDMLKSFGLPAGDTLIDSQTRQSLRAVQSAFGLEETGVLDVETLLALLMIKAYDDRRSPEARKRSGPSVTEAAKSRIGGKQETPSTTAVGAGAQPSAAGDLTPEKLMRMSPGLSPEKAAEVAPHLDAAMKEAGITTPERQAAFIAQLAHESGNFKYSEEIASGRAYEGRRDLGNTQPGDGERFKGRGYIQLTGRANYAAAGKALGLDLIGHPELAARPENAARIAAWFWNSRGLNAKADAGDFDGITKAINGGFNGKADRDRRFAIALRNVDDGTAVA